MRKARMTGITVTLALRPLISPAMKRPLISPLHVGNFCTSIRRVYTATYYCRNNCIMKAPLK